MSLAETLDPLTWDAAFWLQSVDDPDTILEDLGAVCLDVEEKLRAIAIIRLLTEAYTDGFLHNLMRGAKVWEGFLTRCRAEGGIADHNFCAGVFGPFLDAVAARDFALATHLASLAPTQFRDGHEHEADFCYARVLHAIAAGSPSGADLLALINVCEQKGDAISGARAEVCRSLLSFNQAAFDDSFALLLNKRRAEIAADVARGQVATALIVAQREVFIEGIAILNLAEKSGLTTDADYLMCPSLARMPMQRAFPGR